VCGAFFCAVCRANRGSPDLKNEFGFLKGNLAVPDRQTAYGQVAGGEEYWKIPTRTPDQPEDFSNEKAQHHRGCDPSRSRRRRHGLPDSGENHQDHTNSTGANPYVTYSGGSYQRGGYKTYAQQPVQPAHHQVVTPRAKR